MAHGQFCWYELMTSDPTAAAAFYGTVVGWTAEDMPGMAYTVLKAGSAHFGGVMTLPDEAKQAGAPPAWIGYVHVDDVDAMLGRIPEAGGTVARGPMDIPGIGRFAVVTDPPVKGLSGAHFIVFTPNAGSEQPPVAPMTPGHVGWHELSAGDLETSFAFYETLFGWKRTSVFDMGPMGPYQIFATGDLPDGGMMTKMEKVPVPFWLYYFVVPALDAAIARITDHGGAILNGPMEVPGGAWIVQARDPQGAFFALVAAVR